MSVKNTVFLNILSGFALVCLPPALFANEHLELSLEELINTTVYTASRFPQKSSDAPAAVSIVTQEDIRIYGYETLADVLASIRGMHGSYDHNYDYLGIRGFGRTGNYNNRFLLVIDGHRMNDAIYENAAIGRELSLDLDLVDHIEIVRGPGSSIYGSNAFLGVISVFTRKGRDIDGWQFSMEGGGKETLENQLSYGKRFSNGVELLASGTYFNSAGQSGFSYVEPEFGIANKQFGHIKGLDGEEYRSLQAKLTRGGLSMMAAYIRREKEVPT